MDKEKVYNEAVGGDEGFAAGDGYPSCDGEPCANVTDESSADADTMAGDRNTPKAASEELPSRDWEAEIAEWQDKYLRLQAEFDNFRKRTTKEKEQSYGNGKADAVTKMLPIYDNLERALNQPTEDAAYKKGVELTMTELLKILNGLGVEVFGEVGDTFDPNLHNAVMHLDSEEHDENVITQVFQKGFKMGDKIVRFAMVQVAN